MHNPTPAAHLSSLALLAGGLATAGALAQTPASAPAAASTSSPTLAAVKARGVLTCGVIGSSANFSLPDSQGVMRGIDADSCRAIAAAVFGDPNKVKYVSLTPAQRLVAVQSGEVDVAYANITWTMTRETKSGVQFAAINHYDTIGFMVPKSLKVGTTTTKCPSNPLGIKGCGEAGAIAAPAAVINAITDAIGTEDLAMPATAPAAATISGDGVSPAARAAASGSPPGSAAEMARAVAGRLAGSGSRQRRMTFSTAGSMSAATEVMLARCAESWRSMSCWRFLAS